MSNRTILFLVPGDSKIKYTPSLGLFELIIFLFLRFFLLLLFLFYLFIYLFHFCFCFYFSLYVLFNRSSTDSISFWTQFQHLNVLVCKTVFLRDHVGDKDSGETRLVKKMKDTKISHSKPKPKKATKKYNVTLKI